MLGVQKQPAKHQIKSPCYWPSKVFGSLCFDTSLSRMIHSIWSKTKFEALDTSAKILAFRSCQIQYTVAAKPSLREKLTKLLPCQETVANRIHSSKLFIILGMLHLSQTFHQIPPCCIYHVLVVQYSHKGFGHLDIREQPINWYLVLSSYWNTK